MSQKNLFAVAAGDYFGMMPLDELDGIALEENDIGVRVDDCNYYLYTGKSEEDRAKCAELLTRYEKMPVEGYKVEPVVMQGELEFLFPGFQKDEDSLLFGGFCFVCDGKKIPFDFSGMAWNIEQNGSNVSVAFETGDTPFGTDYFLDDCYAGSYPHASLRIHDITARFLSQASSIEEFTVSLEHNGEEYGAEDICCFGSFKLKSLSFSDLNKEYTVAQDVLEDYNEAIAKDSSIWICAYRSSLGFPDDFDNLTYIRVPVGWLAGQLEKEGISLGTWLSEYTADDTEEIAHQALADGVLLDCSNARIRTVLSHDSSLESKIRDAQSRVSEPPAKDVPPSKDSALTPRHANKLYDDTIYESSLIVSEMTRLLMAS